MQCERTPCRVAGGRAGGQAEGQGTLHTRPLGRLGARRGLGERARYCYTRWKLSSNHETHTGIKICEHASKLQLMELFLPCAPAGT